MGTFGLFMSVFLMVLEGRGTVCDSTGAFILFVLIGGGGSFVELPPFLISVVLLILDFPPGSAPAARVPSLITLTLHLLASTVDIREAALLVWIIFSPAAA